MQYVKKNLEQLSHMLAQQFVNQAKFNISNSGSFHVALSGGNTPQLFYSLLANKPYVDQIDWQFVHIYQTDERFVPESHIDNNFNMISSRFLSHVSLNVANIHRIKTEDITPHESAILYENKLNSNLPKNEKGLPQFDFVLLGVGVDGHIASLFPDDKESLNSNNIVVNIDVKHLQSRRISLTLQAINSAILVAVLVAGESKAHVVKSVFSNLGEFEYPIQLLKPSRDISWYIDYASAGSHIEKISNFFEHE